MNDIYLRNCLRRKLRKSQEGTCVGLSLGANFTARHLYQMVENDGELFTVVRWSSENWAQPF